jgi:hypothetical protein
VTEPFESQGELKFREPAKKATCHTDARDSEDGLFKDCPGELARSRWQGRGLPLFVLKILSQAIERA